jgi:hypothetical protein
MYRHAPPQDSPVDAATTSGSAPRLALGLPSASASARHMPRDPGSPQRPGRWCRPRRRPRAGPAARRRSAPRSSGVATDPGALALAPVSPAPYARPARAGRDDRGDDASERAVSRHLLARVVQQRGRAPLLGVRPAAGATGLERARHRDTLGAVGAAHAVPHPLLPRFERRRDPHGGRVVERSGPQRSEVARREVPRSTHPRPRCGSAGSPQDELVEAVQERVEHMTGNRPRTRGRRSRARRRPEALPTGQPALGQDPFEQRHRRAAGSAPG